MYRSSMLKLATVAIAIAAATPAIAQEAPAAAPPPSPEEMIDRDTITLAGGVGMTPEYEGADEYRLIPAVAVRGKYKGFSFSTRGLYLYVDVVPARSAKLDFNAGPILGLRLNRTRHHLKDNFVDLLPTRKRAIEAGGFVGVTGHGLTNPYDSLSVRLDVTHDIGGAHKSTIVSPNIDFSTPLSQTTYVSVSTGLEFVSNRFADYYFSSPAVPLLGVPGFNADGGLKNWKLGVLLNQSLSGNLLHGLSAFGTVNYSRLVGDFKRSYIVSERGSANQWLLAAGIAYTW